LKIINKKYRQENNKLIVVLGPTASGKSDLAVQLAKRFNGEVISADSRQIYKGMDIGSGKITKKEMQGVPHHLLDVASPRRRFTVAQYQKLAWKAIKDIWKRGKLPILCGGTGFYIQSIVDELVIPTVPPDTKLRKELEKLSTEKLFAKLRELDSRRAKNIDRYNRRRLIRALEIVIKTGKPVPIISKLHEDRPRNITRTVLENINTLQLGITKSKKELKTRIKKRLLKRLKRGMIAEVKKLHRDGVSWKRLEEFGLEYRHLARYLQNKISKPEMIVQLEKEINQYAKRQMTWFKRDNRIKWIKNYKEAKKLTRQFLS
jgi:tRNA dimethylallyltransferase